MPTFDIYDVFCFSSGDVAVSTTFDFADATLIEPVTIEADDYFGNPYIRFDGDPNPSMFGGSPATFLGQFQMDANLADGTTQTLNGQFVETVDGSTYIVFRDTEGDFEIVDGTFTVVGQPREPILGTGLDDNNQDVAACFTRGMMIRTDKGAVAIEDLQVGDQIWTADNGFQTLKFVTNRAVPAMGSMVPVLFNKGAIGNNADIIVSQNHRFHVGSLPMPVKRRFGTHQDYLLQAVALCNGSTIRLYPEIGTVEYFHLMFDNHELLECHGTISESWQPTRNALAHDPAQAEELLAIFPGIADRKACDPGALVRHEIQIRQ